jgi:hydroxymethylbilane synthase
MKKCVYFSREPEQIKAIVPILEKENISIRAVSLINTKEVYYKLPEVPFEWLFFFSSNAVEYFFSQNPKLPENLRYGAIGAATASTLKKFKEVSYVGSGNNTEKISRDFLGVLGNETVLVPQSDISVNALSKIAQVGRCLDLICYRTALAPVKIEPADVMVFSSPSNVHSYFLMNSWPIAARAVSFGPATTGALKDHGVEPWAELENMEPQKIGRAIIEVLCSSGKD